MKSFSQKTKESLCKVVPGKSCCVDAEMMGILMFAGRFKDGKIRVSSESSDVMKHFAVLVKRCCGTAALVKENKNNYFCLVSNEKIFKMITKYETTNARITELFAADDCCKSAFLRGAFLGGGLVVDPQKTYNMEFITTGKRIHEDFNALLAEMGLGFKAAKRRASLVLYSKNSDTICDALAYMGAVSAQMQIINVRIERELRSDLNRVSNGEIANMDKVFDAATRQLAAINKIEETIGIKNLPEDLQAVAEARLNNKELSLDALGKKLNPPLTKSGVNHRLKRITDIAEKQ